jgi:hypothetical protein
MTISRLRKYEDKVTAARRAAASEQDWERVVVPDPTLSLVSTGWENDSTDVHGIACVSYATDARRVQTVTLDCYCGHSVAADAGDAAFDLLVAHAAQCAEVAA